MQAEIHDRSLALNSKIVSFSSGRQHALGEIPSCVLDLQHLHKYTMIAVCDDSRCRARLLPRDLRALYRVKLSCAFPIKFRLSCTP